MAWEQYEERIVKVHKVHLTGWPNGLVFNIHKLGSKALAECLNALRSDPPKCYWVKLSEEELQARASTVEVVTKPRKSRADKGEKRTSKKRKHLGSGESSTEKENAPISPETVDNSD
jgi:hypothetical protein